MMDILYLAWRYLTFHRWKTMVLLLAVTLTIYLPAGLLVLANQGEQHLASRANQSPILIGAKGSPIELVLNSLYFRSKVPDRIRFEEVSKLLSSRLALPIPLYVRFHCQDDPIVATSIDYFEFRKLQLQQGRPFARLGDCVVGAKVARKRGLKVADTLISTPEQAFDVAGSYPLKMHITGILASNDTPDDEAIFVDIKTAWIIEGIGHGHQDLAPASGAGHVESKQAVPNFNEVTDRNLDSFHFHGNPDEFPITAILAVPENERNGTLLLGRYQAKDSKHQAIEPRMIIRELIGTVVTLKQFALAGFAMVGVAAVALLALVQSLSIRLRQDEIHTLEQIGGSRLRIRGMLLAEATVVLFSGLSFASILTWLTAGYGTELVRIFINQ
jgi:putative ABC transport system permease protein